MTATDFANSYVFWAVPPNPDDKRTPGHKPWGNSARIQIDASCQLFHETPGATDTFYLIVPCRTEWVYQEGNLFQIPSGEYRVLHSRKRHLSLGARMTCEPDQPKSSAPNDTFTSLDFTVTSFPSATVLDTDEAVVEVVQKGLALVAQTEIWDEAGGWRAVIEYPIKTMNFHPERKRFQVDTGPLPWPDLASQAEERIEWFSLAHVAYNTFDRAEFIIRQPTPVINEGREVCHVLHYSRVEVHEARNTLLCGGTL